MKKIFLILFIFSISCSSKIDQRIIGIWNVESNFYRATYKIEESDKKLIGKVIYYNDDTTVLHETKTDKDIFLHNLKYKNKVFIDAVSGATKTTENLTIKIKHNDTLEVTNYINNKPLIENWSRKQQ